MWLLLALACRPPDPDPGDTDTDLVVVDDTDRIDIDEDGYSADSDCNDYNPSTHPGADEVWDGRDNDCDGRIDGEGVFTGAHRVEATAIYEGQPVEMALDCTVTLSRTPAVLDFEVHCVPDEGDADAALLLGVVTIEPSDNGVSGAAWQGDITITSENGWSAEGVGQATWQTMDQVGLWTQLSSASLSWQGSGQLSRSE